MITDAHVIDGLVGSASEKRLQPVGTELELADRGKSPTRTLGMVTSRSSHVGDRTVHQWRRRQ